MLDQNITLNFEIYDQLITWYRIWYSYSSTMGLVSDEYQRTGNINDPIITKDDLEHLTTIRENIEGVYYDGLFLKEVEQNLLSMDTPNKGVIYLNKLVKLINPFIVYNSGKYLEHTCNTRLLGYIETVDSKAINAFLFEVQQFSISFGYIEDTIVRLLSESVWYREYISLIKVEGYKTGVSVANDLDKVSTATMTVQQPEPTEPGAEETDLNVKLLIAYQSGILTGEFHKLPIEKQYAILAVLFGRSKANVKNALTALTADANTAKNPRNLPKVVEKTNDLITQKDLGINPIKSRIDKKG